MTRYYILVGAIIALLVGTALWPFYESWRERVQVRRDAMWKLRDRTKHP